MSDTEAEDQTEEAPTEEEKQPDVVEASWDETQTAFKRREEETRELGVELPDMGDEDEIHIATFEVRGLDQTERDEVEKAAASVKKQKRARRRRNGGGDDVEIDTGALRSTMLKHGIVAGPPGFKPHREDHLEQIPPGVKDELVEEIESLSSLDVLEKDQFP